MRARKIIVYRHCLNANAKSFFSLFLFKLQDPSSSETDIKLMRLSIAWADVVTNYTIRALLLLYAVQIKMSFRKMEEVNILYFSHH
jgi:hypothetical protein